MTNDTGTRAKDIQIFADLVALADEEFLDEYELSVIKAMALEDGQIDACERAILKKIFDNISEKQTPPETWADIQDFRKKYRI